MLRNSPLKIHPLLEGKKFSETNYNTTLMDQLIWGNKKFGRTKNLGEQKISEKAGHETFST